VDESVDFLQVRRVERAAETRRNFCFWLPTGLPRHARRRGNVCLTRHSHRRSSPGNLGAADGDLYPALSRRRAWRGSLTLPRHGPWRGKTALPRLSFTKTSTLPRPRFKLSRWRGNTNLPRHGRRRGNAVPPRHAVWRGRAPLPTSPVELRVTCSAAPHRMARRGSVAAPSCMARQVRVAAPLAQLESLPRERTGFQKP
jgi:hypothetical protein